MKQQVISYRPLHSWRYFQVRPISGAIGAEIHGVDIAQPLEDKVIAEIREAFLEYLVIFFRDQKLTPEQQVAFARHFGEPVVSAIVWHEDSSARMAVVDGLPVMTGEFVGTAKVQEILRDRILFVEEGKLFTVSVDPQ
jgi:alpha-ketoglutarate-dependent taurine dioxygenase